MKEEAKMVYLLECLQKTPPPVSMLGTIWSRWGMGGAGRGGPPVQGGHVAEPCSIYEQVLGPAVLCALLSKREWASPGGCAGASSASLQKGL